VLAQGMPETYDVETYRITEYWTTLDETYPILVRVEDDVPALPLEPIAVQRAVALAEPVHLPPRVSLRQWSIGRANAPISIPMLVNERLPGHLPDASILDQLVAAVEEATPMPPDDYLDSWMGPVDDSFDDVELVASPPPNTPRQHAINPLLAAALTFAQAGLSPANRNVSVYVCVIALKTLTYTGRGARRQGLRIECVDSDNHCGDFVVFAEDVPHFVDTFRVDSHYMVTVSTNTVRTTHDKPSFTLWTNLPVDCTDTWAGDLDVSRTGIACTSVHDVLAQTKGTVVSFPAAAHEWQPPRPVGIHGASKARLTVVDAAGQLMDIEAWASDIQLLGPTTERGKLAYFECFRVAEWQDRRFVTCTGGSRVTPLQDDQLITRLKAQLEAISPGMRPLDQTPLKTLRDVSALVSAADSGKSMSVNAELMFIRLEPAGLNHRAVRPVCPVHKKWCRPCPTDNGDMVLECPAAADAGHNQTGTHIVQVPHWYFHFIVVLADANAFIETRLYSDLGFTRVFYDAPAADLADMGEGDEQDFLTNNLRIRPLTWLRVRLSISNYAQRGWEADIVNVTLCPAEMTVGQLEIVACMADYVPTLNALTGVDTHETLEDAIGRNSVLRKAIADRATDATRRIVEDAMEGVDPDDDLSPHLQ
jgi:hypothetical protein